MPSGPINTNGQVGGGAILALGSKTSSWLYAVCAVMAVSAFIIGVMALRRPRGTRAFHHISVMILITASVAYFSMASDLGKSPTLTTMREITSRQIWLLLEILLGSGLPLSDIAVVIFADLVMIIVGLIGSLTPTNYKWGYFTSGMIALFYIGYHVLGPARSSARALGPAWSSAFNRGAVYLLILWTLYPIAWGLSEGGNVIGISGEMIFYGVLDLLAKPVFCFIHTFGIANLDYQLLQLQSGKFSDFATGYTTTGGPGLTGSRVGHLHDHDHEAAGAIGGAALGAEAIHHHHHDEKRMRGGPVAPGTGRGAKRELFGGRKKGQVAEVSAPVGMTTTTGSGVVA